VRNVLPLHVRQPSVEMTAGTSRKY